MHLLPEQVKTRFTKDCKMVFFTGAGISAESGVPTFRDKDGYWSKYDPMILASVDGFRQDPELVWEWYLYRREKIISVEPNPAHFGITQFQSIFNEAIVATQNVDDLHNRAGNREVYELHGNIFATKCLECGMALDMPPNFDLKTHGIPQCECGGMARPGVVWFGESLPRETLTRVFELTRRADVFFSIGTSTEVYPAAQLPFEAKNHGAVVIEINPNRTPFSVHADLVLQQPSGEILPQLFEELQFALA